MISPVRNVRPVNARRIGPIGCARKNSRNSVRYARAEPESEHIAVPQKDHPLLGATQFRRRFRQGRQYGIQVERGTTDDLEHVGGRRLLLEAIRSVRRCAVRPFFPGRRRIPAAFRPCR